MIAAVGPHLRDFTGPVRLVVGELDRVERPEALRAAFAAILPLAIVKTVTEVGHLHRWRARVPLRWLVKTSPRASSGFNE